MTEQQTDRDALRKLADAATEGPWPLLSGGEYVGGVGILVAPDDGGVSPANAAFIATARTAVPQLLDQLDQAEAELDSWMARAYEAEKRAWQAEARIKAVEDVLDAVDGDYDSHGAHRLGVTRRIRRALEG